jgi:hypothetical protein
LRAGSPSVASSGKLTRLSQSSIDRATSGLSADRWLLKVDTIERASYTRT